MEVAALMIIFIPACILGFLIGILGIFRKNNASILLSIVFAIAFGCASIFIVGIFNDVLNESRNYIGKRKAVDEAKYFNKAISGNYSEKDIKEHYVKQPLSSQGTWLISSDKNTLGSLVNPKTVVNPKIIPVLIELFEKNPLLLGALANRPETALDLKLKTADHPDPLAVRDMAFNNNTPQSVLIRLAAYKDSQMARYACQNKNAPEVAKRICDFRSYLDREPFIDLEVHGFKPIQFEFTSKEEELSLWMEFVKDDREYVRLWVAQSPHTPSSILAHLGSDSSDKIIKYVFLHKNTSPRIRNKIANYYHTTTNKLLLELCYSNEFRFRAATAASTISSNAILEILSKDSEYNVRWSVAANPNTSSDILEYLSKSEIDRDSSSQILLLIARHANTPISVLEDFYKQTKYRRLSEWAERSLRNRGIMPPVSISR